MQLWTDRFDVLRWQARPGSALFGSAIGVGLALGDDGVAQQRRALFRGEGGRLGAVAQNLGAYGDLLKWKRPAR